MLRSIDVVVEEDAGDVVEEDDGNEVVVELYSHVSQGSNTFITIISANGHSRSNGP